MILVLLLWALTVIALAWGAYEAFYVVIWHGRIWNARHADARRTEEQRSNITAQRYNNFHTNFALFVFGEVH